MTDNDAHTIAATIVTVLTECAKDEALLEVARKAVENALVEWRDNGRFVLRNNGFTIKNYDGTHSDIIRFGTEVGIKIALEAMAAAVKERADAAAHE